MPKRPLALVLILWGLSGCSAQNLPELKAGDLILQDAPSGQSAAIRLATGSEYTHVGIVLEKNGELVVYEAVGPVKITSVKKYIKRDADGPITILRFVDQARLEVGGLDSLEAVAEAYMGRPYDVFFDWDEEKLYCSEFVWKVYQKGLNVDLVGLRPLRDYHLDSPEVLEKIQERYGESVPLDQLMVAPSDLLSSPYLQIVTEN